MNTPKTRQLARYHLPPEQWVGSRNRLERSKRVGEQLVPETLQRTIPDHIRCHEPSEVKTTRRRPRGGVHTSLDGRSDARARQGRGGRIDSRFLEPACGSGNFLVRILLRRKQGS
jgi:hypothetical protein